MKRLIFILFLVLGIGCNEKYTYIGITKLDTGYKEITRKEFRSSDDSTAYYEAFKWHAIYCYVANQTGFSYQFSDSLKFRLLDSDGNDITRILLTDKHLYEDTIMKDVYTPDWRLGIR